jgi:hypothetical protein
MRFPSGLNTAVATPRECPIGSMSFGSCVKLTKEKNVQETRSSITPYLFI